MSNITKAALAGAASYVLAPHVFNLLRSFAPGAEAPPAQGVVVVDLVGAGVQALTAAAVYALLE